MQPPVWPQLFLQVRQSTGMEALLPGMCREEGFSIYVHLSQLSAQRVDQHFEEARPVHGLANGQLML